MDVVRWGEGRHGNDALRAVEKERDFYRSLLQLGGEDVLDAFLAEALALIVDVADASCGYIELGRTGSAVDGPRWSIGHGCSDEHVDEIRSTISHGVIAEAIATGSTIAIPSALADPRFGSRGSVRRNRIEAVLCAPIGTSPAAGVVYLQSRVDQKCFSEDDRQRIETFARHVAPYAERLIIKHERSLEADATRPFRSTLDASRLIGRSAPLARVLKDVRTVASKDVVVLLAGPTGTGKTEVARVIHDNGPRRERPFVEVSCANLPENLVENELFGAQAGAHATANRRIEGKVAAAHGGTLFLDEVGELPLVAQAKLLQFLQSKEYYPLGAARPLRADVRVIAATNVDLDTAVEERRFREDLYYRLRGFFIRIPSLAERRGDLVDLATFFCARTCEAEGLRALRLSPGALSAIESEEWPGNIRQLGARIKEAVLRADADGMLVVERGHLFSDEEPPQQPPLRPTLQAATREFQGEYVRRVLEETGWNVAQAAEQMDIVRSHAYNLIKAHRLKRGER